MKWEIGLLIVRRGMNNIKDYRSEELKIFVLANVLMLLCIQKIITWDRLMGGEAEVLKLVLTLIDSTVLLAIWFSFVYLADALFPTNIKNKIVYLGSPLPGQTVFTRLSTKTEDERFTKEQIIEKYSDIIKNIPKCKKEKLDYENSKWYSIYNLYRDRTMVLVSNRDYLLCRDMTVSTVVIFILYFVMVFAFHVFEFKVESLLYLLIIFILTNWATRQKGMRYVNNVIACDLNEK